MNVPSLNFFTRLHPLLKLLLVFGHGKRNRIGIVFMLHLRQNITRLKITGELKQKQLKMAGRKNIPVTMFPGPAVRIPTREPEPKQGIMTRNTLQRWMKQTLIPFPGMILLNEPERKQRIMPLNTLQRWMKQTLIPFPVMISLNEPERKQRIMTLNTLQRWTKQTLIPFPGMILLNEPERIPIPQAVRIQIREAAAARIQIREPIPLIIRLPVLIQMRLLFMILLILCMVTL